MSNAKQFIVSGVPVSVKDEVARQSIGDLSNLNTTSKDNLVAAINEASQSGGGDENAVKFVQQSLSADQKAQARTNIEAYSKPSSGIPSSDLADGVIPEVPLISTNIFSDAASDVKTSSPKSVKTYVDACIAAVVSDLSDLEDEVGAIDIGAYVMAWDGNSEPVVANIPAGVSVTYNSTTYTGTLAASASTIQKIYLVATGTTDNYDRYITVGDSTYSWVNLGTTEITLSDYAAKAEVDELTISERATNTDIPLAIPSKGYHYFDFVLYPGEKYIIVFNDSAVIRTYDKNNNELETIGTYGGTSKTKFFVPTVQSAKIGGYFNTPNDYTGVLNVNHVVNYYDFNDFEDGSYILATNEVIRKADESKFMRLRLKVLKGMRFEIRGNGAYYSRWLWATSGDGVNIIRGAGFTSEANSKLLSPVTITIEDGENWLYFNFEKSFIDGSYVHLVNPGSFVPKNTEDITVIQNNTNRVFDFSQSTTKDAEEPTPIQFTFSKPEVLPERVLVRLEDPDGVIDGGYGITNFQGNYPFGEHLPVNEDFVFDLSNDLFQSSTRWGVYVGSAKIVESGVVTLKLINNYGKTLNERVELLEKDITDKTIIPPALEQSNYESEVSSIDSVQKTIQDYSIESFNETIVINGQNDFGYIDGNNEVNVIKQSINAAIANGKTSILVLFKADKLYYFEKHLDFTSENYPNATGVKIKLQGVDGCKLIAAGRDYRLADATRVAGDNYYCEHSADDIVRTVYLSKDDEELTHIGRMRGTSKLIEAVSYVQGSETLVDEAKIFLDSGDLLENPTHIILSHRFRSAMFPVVMQNGVAKIVDGWLHFTARPISMANHNQFYVGNFTIDKLNYDITYGAYERYKLININSGDVSVHGNEIQVKLGIGSVHECVSQTFVKVGNLYGVNGQDTKMQISYSPFSHIEIAGFTFIGNADYGVNNYTPQIDQNSLIRIDAFNNSGIYIHDNKFKSIRSKICGIAGYFIEDGVIRPSIDKDDVAVRNVLFSHNKAYDCFLSMVDASRYTRTIYCVGNYAKNMNRSMYYDGVFGLTGRDFLIKDNKAEDFCWGAVRSGIEDSSISTAELVSQYGSEGIVENNEFGWSKEYADDAFEHSMIDVGVIYTYCRNARFIVRDNIVYNYKSLGVSYGIYIDGYAENAKVYRNLIINSGNEKSINMYRYDGDASASYRRSNNNLSAFNVVTSSFRFRSWDDCIKAQNYLMLPSDAGAICEIDGPETEDDYIINHAKTVGNTISIPNEYKVVVDSMNIPTSIRARIVFDYH